MEDILGRLLHRIEYAPIDPLPSDNFFMENIFHDEVYRQIIASLPDDQQYEDINHPDAILPDKTITRKLLALCPETISCLPTSQQSLWHNLWEIFTSTALQQAIINKFKGPIRARFGEQLPELVTVPILYRDYPGYQISVHTDAPYKIATMQLYFPADDSLIACGTSFHIRDRSGFPLYKTNPFKPNSGYAFARTETSWHSVKRLPQISKPRNSLALTIYLKGQEYKSNKVGM